jgi:hypothetical protein
VLLVILFAVGGLPFLGAICATQYTFDNVELKQSDVLLLIIVPPPADLQVNVQQLSGNRHALLIRTNESSQDLVSGFSRLHITPFCSEIQLGVEGALYNVTIEFVAQNKTRLYYGAVTLDPTDNYPGKTSYSYGSSQTYFVPFSPVLSMPAGNVTISMVASFEWKQQNQTVGSILAPITSSNAAKLILFAAIAVGISYGEAFFLVSSYFENKLAGLSFRRKVLVLVSVLVAAVAIAWLYGVIVG